MNCPYNGFKECDWENCAARMYAKSPVGSGNYMRVCAIAYNGKVPQQQEEENKNICSECAWDSKLELIEHHQTFTNADHIRSMSDKELAKMLAILGADQNSPAIKINAYDPNDAERKLKWLQQPTRYKYE